MRELSNQSIFSTHSPNARAQNDTASSNELDSSFSESMDSSLRGGNHACFAALPAKQVKASDHLKEAKRKLGQLKSSELGPNLRIPWLELPRALTASECGSSPLRMSMTFQRDGDDGSAPQRRASDAAWSTDLEQAHPFRVLAQHSMLDSASGSSANTNSVTRASSNPAINSAFAVESGKASGLSTLRSTGRP